MQKSLVTVYPLAFPRSVRQFLLGARVYDSSCGDEARVYYSDWGCFIKTAAPGTLRREAELARVFHSLGLGVEVLAYETGAWDYLVTRSALGEDLTHLCATPERVCRILAKALRTLHTRSAAGLQPASGQQRYLQVAGGNLCDGNFDPSYCLRRFNALSREEAWKIMQENRHRLQWDTLIHGDACLPNVLCHAGEFECFIDCAMAGLGDRHIDLYWAVWSLEFNLGTDRYTDLFLDLYGRENFDADMLRVIAAFEAFG